MNTQSPYNANPELSTMKEDVASRNYNLNIKEMLIVGGTVVAGALVGAAVLPLVPIFAGATLLGAVGGGAVGLMAGNAVAQMATLKERTKLKIDEEMVQSYMSGKNYWGEGYREEVAEHGYGGPQAPNHGGVPNQRGTPQQR